jgi:hypothetical protein
VSKRLERSTQEGRAVAGQHGVDEDKSGRPRHAYLGIHAPDEREEPDADAESENEQYGPQEFRDRHDHDAADVGDLFLERAAPRKHEQAAADAQDDAKRQSRDDEFERGRQCGQNQVGDAAAELDRAAEIAVHDAAEPDRILHRYGPVEAHVAPHLGHFLLRRIGRQRHCERVGRDQPQDDEDQDRDDQERGEGDQKSAIDDSKTGFRHADDQAFSE